MSHKVEVLNGCGMAKKGKTLDDIYYSNIDEESKNTPQETITVRLEKTVAKDENFPVLNYKLDPKKDFFTAITMKEYLRDIRIAAKSFITLGLDPKKSVGIIGFNHPAWFISELGAIFAGGIVCGIYTTNSADICKFIMNDCNCQIAVVENDEQLNKILSILPGVPHLKAIVKYTGTVTDEFKNKYNIPIYTWSEFLKIGSEKTDVELEKRLSNIKPEDCAMLIYTSGTTGMPKGVMLSHDNVIFTSKMVVRDLEILPFKHRLISYLPLSHIAANLLDIISSINIGVAIYFAEPSALRGSLGKTIKEVRPTLFIGVPRIFEKIEEQIDAYVSKISNKKNDATNEDQQYSAIKEALGFDCCEYIASAAAPISLKTLEFFKKLNITIYNVYGMSECSGPQTIGIKNKFKIGSAGSLMKGAELKISEPDENLCGEICMRGRHVFLGYYNSEEKTREVIDADGWLHSGDLGIMENGEFLFVTGRIKELIVTAGGENIAPVPIEDMIKEELPFISNVMLIGDQKKFISCLLTLKTEINLDSQLPMDNLTEIAIRSFENIGIKACKVEQILHCIDPILRKTIDDTIKKVNSSAVSRAGHVQKWIFLPKDFSIGGGELGPTLKLKRMFITEKYSELIDSLYAP